MKSMSCGCRCMYWADCGVEPRIERAMLDGSERITLLDTELEWPKGLTIGLYTPHAWIHLFTLGTFDPES